MSDGFLKLSLQGMIRSALIGSVLSALLGVSLSAKIIVTVDGISIPDSVFNPIKQQNPNFNYDALPEAQKQQLLDEVINTVIVANVAKKEGLDKSEEYKMANIQLLYQLWISKQGESLDKTVNVTDDEAQRFYNNNLQSFITLNATLRHILVSKEDEAKNIVAEIGKVPKNKTKDKFSELAKKYSIDPGSKENGGLIENMNLNDPNVAPEFVQEAKKMQPNSYTRVPVKTRYGYHIIYLEKIDQAVTEPFSKVKSQILQFLKQQRMQEIVMEKVNRMRASANITYPK